MNFRMSKNIGFQVDHVEKAKLFYERVMGLKLPAQSEVDEVKFKNEPQFHFSNSRQ